MGPDGLTIQSMRIDTALVKRGLVSSRERARRLILAGAVHVNGQVVLKPSVAVFPSDIIELQECAETRYVSRGGLKLEKAIRLGGFDLNNATAIDVGASTGGFTDCMLEHGAALVYAVDVGHGQLDKKLVSDQRVVSLEGVDIRDFERLSKIIPPNSADFCAVDVAFISVTKVFPSVIPFLKKNAGAVCLIKPQFEAGRGNTGKRGVVTNPKIHKSVIERTVSFFGEHGFGLLGLTYSPVKGGDGNIEYLALLRQGQRVAGSINAGDIVSEAHGFFGR